MTQNKGGSKPNEVVAAYRATTWLAPDESCVIIRGEMGAAKANVTLKGPPDVGPKLAQGVTYRFHGHWERHEKYGEQFAFVSFSAVAPVERRGVVAYLVAICDGVGEKRAAALWDRYGILTVETLRQNPATVANAGIMPIDAAREASECLKDEMAFESVKVELFHLLGGRGFQVARLIRECLRLWGGRAAEVIRRNPYILLLKRLTSCGWNRCDRLYLDLGGKPDRLKRQALAAVHHLKQDSAGHTWYPAEQVGRAIEAAVSGPGVDPLRALRLAIRAGLLRRRTDGAGNHWLAERSKADNEAQVAKTAKDLIAWRTVKIAKGSWAACWMRRSAAAATITSGTPDSSRTGTTISDSSATPSDAGDAA